MKPQDFVSIFREIQSEWLDYQSSPSNYPEKLFHYTTGHGLEGITKSKSLWASAARYSNDLSEVRYAYDMALPVLDAMKHLFTTEEHKRFLDVLHLSLSTPEWADKEAFMVSFCEANDLLSQWRGYGPGNGYAIGFNLVKENVVQMTTSQGIRLLLRQVDYDSESQKKSLVKILENSASLLSKGLAKYKTDKIIQMMLASVTYSLAEWMYTIKHPTFGQEREWKLLAIPPKALNKFPPFLEFGDAYDSYKGIGARVVGSRMVPYLEFIPRKNEILPMASVTCGPHTHQRLNARAVELLLASNGFEGVRVELSEIPLGN
jgi:hypothetical protein